jgi:hypothetical protein
MYTQPAFEVKTALVERAETFAVAFPSTAENNWGIFSETVKVTQ